MSDSLPQAHDEECALFHLLTAFHFTLHFILNSISFNISHFWGEIHRVNIVKRARHACVRGELKYTLVYSDLRDLWMHGPNSYGTT